MRTLLLLMLLCIPARAGTYKLTGVATIPCPTFICPLGKRTTNFSASCVCVQIDPQGHGVFLTAGHVIKKPSKDYKVIVGSHSYALSVLREYPHESDYVVMLRSTEPIPSELLKVYTLASRSPQRGDSVTVEGFAAGRYRTFNTLVKGYANDGMMVTADMPSQGASGGAVSHNKLLVGLVFAYARGDGFHIPLSYCRDEILKVITIPSPAKPRGPPKKPRSSTPTPAPIPEDPSVDTVPKPSTPKPAPIPENPDPTEEPRNYPDLPALPPKPEDGVLDGITAGLKKIPWDTIIQIALLAAGGASGGLAGWAGIKGATKLFKILTTAKRGVELVKGTRSNEAPSPPEPAIHRVTENRYVTKEVDHIGEAYKEAIRRSAGTSPEWAKETLRTVEHTAKEILRGRNVASRNKPSNTRSGIWTEEDEV